MNRTLYLLLTGAAVVVLLAVTVAGPAHMVEQSGSGFLKTHRLDDQARDFTLPDIKGRRVALHDLRGQWVLVNFWATWCEPCIDELPHLTALAESLRNQPLRLVLVDVDDQVAAVARLADRLAAHTEDKALSDLLQATVRMLRGEFANVLVLSDPGGAEARRWGTEKFPETYLVSPQGRRSAWFIGPKPWGQARAIGELLRLMGAESPAAAGSARRAGSPG